jgi:tRNA modification GTPase
LISIHSKADLPNRRDLPSGSIGVSAKTGEGMATLLGYIVAAAKSLLPTEDALALNRRQAQHLENAAAALEDAARAEELVLAAEALRQARSAFDRLTGRAGVEDVLDALFGRFCLGK